MRVTTNVANVIRRLREEHGRIAEIEEISLGACRSSLALCVFITEPRANPAKTKLGGAVSTPRKQRPRTPETLKTAAYRLSTGLLVFDFGIGGVFHITRTGGDDCDGPPRLGAWKVLAGIALIAPRFPRLKEWERVFGSSRNACRIDPAKHVRISGVFWSAENMSRCG